MDEKTGRWRFRDFTREKGMESLYERFLLNFYRLEQHVFRTRSEELVGERSPLALAMEHSYRTFARSAVSTKPGRITAPDGVRARRCRGVAPSSGRACATGRAVHLRGCGARLMKIGVETSEQHYQPASLFVTEHMRFTYGSHRRLPLRQDITYYGSSGDSVPTHQRRE